jgi:hypothetical protein
VHRDVVPMQMRMRRDMRVLLVLLLLLLMLMLPRRKRIMRQTLAMRMSMSTMGMSTRMVRPMRTGIPTAKRELPMGMCVSVMTRMIPSHMMPLRMMLVLVLLIHHPPPHRHTPNPNTAHRVHPNAIRTRRRHDHPRCRGSSRCRRIRRRVVPVVPPHVGGDVELAAAAWVWAFEGWLSFVIRTYVGRKNRIESNRVEKVQSDSGSKIQMRIRRRRRHRNDEKTTNVELSHHTYER